MHLAINRICLRAALRYATLPRNHPLFPYIRRAIKVCPKKLPSPLHHTIDTFNINPDTTETILPIRQSPKWQPGIKTHIAPSLGRAMADEALDPAFMRLYSDGSGIDGMIGSAAVLYRHTDGNQTVKKVLRFCLGPDTKHTVYEGEIVGGVLAQHLLHNELTGFGRRVSMYIDNQASIMATQSINPTPGHYLLDILHEKVTRSKKKHRNIEIVARWIPSHKDVEGNEEADRQAKRAAKGDANSPSHRLPPELRSPLPHSKSAIQQVMLKDLKAQATNYLRESPQWRKLRHIDLSMPSNRFRKLVDYLPRKHANLLMQLRTGHAPLNKLLYTIKCTDSPVCPACEDAHETVHHFLLSCPAYEHHRRDLFYKLNRGSRSLHTLLSHPKAIKLLFKYIARTGRFKSSLGDMAIPDHLIPAGTGRDGTDLGADRSRFWIRDLLNRPYNGPIPDRV
jgi:hypothetical protein